MIRPSIRMIVLLGLCFVPALLPALGFGALWPLWIGLLVLLILAFGIDAALAPGGDRLELAIHPPPRLYIGDADPLQVELENLTDRLFEVELALDVDSGIEVEVPSEVVLAPRKTHVAWPVTTTRRGEFALRRLWLRWHGPMRLAQKTERRELGQVLSVVPNIRAVRAAAVRFFNDPEFLSGLKTERYAGDGSEFDNLREFLPGMDHRFMDWKASARHRKLLVREFRAERNHHIVLAIDSGRMMTEPLNGLSRLDHAVNAALLLGYCVLKTGDRASLFAFDDAVRLYTDAEGGSHAIHHLQQHAARIEYGQAETNFTLGLTDLATRLKRRSLVVLLTEFADTVTAELMVENLQRLARRHVVVFVTLRDPELDEIAKTPPEDELTLNRCVVATDLLRERKKVLMRLARLGVHTLDVVPSELSPRLLNQYLQIKRRELI